MSKTNFYLGLMALVAMSFFRPSFSFAQSAPKAFTPKIQTPETGKELQESRPVTLEEAEKKATPSATSTPASSASPRRLRQHGLGLGLGQTFLLGDYADHGDDKITLDLLYSYAASYSFDLLVNAHTSEHEQGREKMRVMGLTTSFKGRIVEYDNFSPYFLGGLGFYAPRAKRKDQPATEWTDRKITFGLNFGGGLDLRLNDNYVVGILGQMHWPFTVKQDEGKDLQGYYFKLLITGMYLF